MQDKVQGSDHFMVWASAEQLGLKLNDTFLWGDLFSGLLKTWKGRMGPVCCFWMEQFCSYLNGDRNSRKIHRLIIGLSLRLNGRVCTKWPRLYNCRIWVDIFVIPWEIANAFQGKLGSRLSKCIHVALCLLLQGTYSVIVFITNFSISLLYVT